METLSVLDTSIASLNLGDKIIMQAVEENLYALFDNHVFINLPTHDVISKISYECIRNSRHTFVGGTNLLSSNMNSYNQWKITIWDSLFLKDVILMGVGWWQYQEKPNLYTTILYTRVLSNQYLHAVRDSYTQKHLKSIGINNVVNTSCPTMWSLTEQHCSEIPQEKSNAVLITFTEYNQNQKSDAALFGLLEKYYEHIYFWTQQSGDYAYMRSIGGEKVVYINPNISALDEVLNLDIDYVGTRLHAGVRALQKKKRSLILAVDNRAIEISNDTHLPVIDRNDLASIEKWIVSKKKTQLNLPWLAINQWKDQFKK
jgi:polysaccharide pyruvyl transferase WcaK-like protein